MGQHDENRVPAPEVVAVQAVGENLDLIPTAFIECRSQWTAHALGRMDLVCRACHALHWELEAPQHVTRARAGTFEVCCKHGDAMLERMRALPEPLNTLLTGQDS